MDSTTDFPFADAAGALVLLLNARGDILRLNSAAAAFSEVNEPDVLGRPFWDVFIPPTRRDEARETFLAGGPAHHTEGPWLAAGGSLRHVRWSHAPCPAGILSVGLDVTESRELETRLRPSQKMETVGQLAAGIAHDFNNILTIVLGYSELLQAQLPSDGPERAQADAIQEAAVRGALLTRQLLTFSRKQVVEPVLLDLNEVLSRLEKTLLRLLGGNVHFETRLQTPLDTVFADPGQMEQVVLNLSVNARDAMPDGGRLLLSTERVEVDVEAARALGLARPGPHVVLSASDTGHGMDAAVRAHLFEPFFTTKPPGRGTGLGLSIVYGIVKQAGGSIAVESAPGRGTLFRLYFPAVIGPAAPRPLRSEALDPRGGPETVLVVEDAEAVRLFMRRVLETLGYSVLVAPDGESALRVSWEHRGPLHLLVTDLVMPHLGGRELARLLSRSRPEMRVLFASGYSEEALEPGSALLPKPFSPTLLAARVRELLDRLQGA